MDINSLLPKDKAGQRKKEVQALTSKWQTGYSDF